MLRHDDDPTAPGREPCPALEQVAAYLDGALTPPAARDFRRHELTCPACAQLVVVSRELMRAAARHRRRLDRASRASVD
jgi:hypothetical protein